MAKPTLYIFAISHFCEKARWALDYAGIDYKLKYVAPGVHIQLAKKLGLPGTSVPILKTDGAVIQASDAIIDWVDAHGASPERNLSPAVCEDECRTIEKRLDEKTGVHVRRYYYSEAIPDHPDTVLPIFLKGLSFRHKLLVRSVWPKICGLMIKGMDLGPEQRIESREIIETELNWLDELLSDGRAYLAGDTFTRADLTAASLLAPLVAPPEHPTYAGLQLPPILAGEIAEWVDRPVAGYISNIYREHR